MKQQSAPTQRPRRAIEDIDEFYAETPASLVRGRLVRGGIAASAVAAVSALAFVAPGLAQAAASSTHPAPLGTPTSTIETPAAAGSVESFAARRAVVDRNATRESLSTAELADARAAALVAQDKQVESAQTEAAVAKRVTGLDATTTKIQAESDRRLSLTFLWPTNGGVSSPWGMRFHPILHYSRLHAGLDIGGTCGQPIWATRDGVVTTVGSGSQSGNNVRINHGDATGSDIETSYLHMNTISVRQGQSVKRGQVIGTVGNTGLSTACHLHFALYENGENVNPMPFLKP